ncbi:hypothetical protein [Streptomyces sp. NPDC051662]|uniref:hypothetical protein n=1 Tax=Streptomyces sp. NPDC051662 TaxID=3154750 RepID=UPI0034493768
MALVPGAYTVEISVNGRRSGALIEPIARTPVGVVSLAPASSPPAPSTRSRSVRFLARKDGVHLTELGDTVLLQQTERLLAEHRIVEKLLDYPLLERNAALTAYGPMFARYRPVGA